MSRRYSRAVAPLLAPAHDGLGGMAVLSARADLSWLARHQRDVAAREAGGGRALTGMPVHRSTEPRLPGALSGPDLSGEIARKLDELVRELLDVGWEAKAEAETGRWYQAALVVEQVCETDMDALAWWDSASGLRARAERALGADAHGRWLGPCPVPSCPGEVRLGDDQAATHCPVCGIFVTREQQHAYILEIMGERVMTLSEITTALVTVGAETPYDTVKSWARRGRIAQDVEPVWPAWPGVPFVVPVVPTGLYRFSDAFTLATRRATRVRVKGLAA